MITHSERSSQYCSAADQGLINTRHPRCSMSTKVNYYDNACAKSLSHGLKVDHSHSKQRLVVRSDWPKSIKTAPVS